MVWPREPKVFPTVYNVISYALGFAISSPGTEPKASDIIVRNYFILQVSMLRTGYVRCLCKETLSGGDKNGGKYQVTDSRCRIATLGASHIVSANSNSQNPKSNLGRNPVHQLSLLDHALGNKVYKEGIRFYNLSSRNSRSQALVKDSRPQFA
jgi:hypothetical protein